MAHRKETLTGRNLWHPGRKHLRIVTNYIQEGNTYGQKPMPPRKETLTDRNLWHPGRKHLRTEAYGTQEGNTYGHKLMPAAPYRIQSAAL